MFRWPPPRASRDLAVVVPSSNLSIYKDLRLKTRLAGEYARALAVFRVSTLAVFRDPEATEEDHRLFLKVLRHVLVPPYLRVKTEPLDRDLRFAGLLPPLTIYPHNPENRPPRPGDVRFGLVLGERGLVDIGWRKPCRLVDAGYAKPGEIKLIRVDSANPLLCREETAAQIYAGYRVVEAASSDDLARLLEGYDLVINTSKRGEPLRGGVLKRVSRAMSLCLLFGNPRKDFDELAGSGVRIDLTINFIPNQGTLTVRTHEALVSTLAILNALLEHRWTRP